MPRILVVDDFKDIPEQVQIYFQSDKDYIVDIANSGEDAIRSLTTNCLDHQCYDLIIIDFAMPVMDGLTVAKRIRELEKHLGWKKTCIIFFTAHADIARVSSSILSDLGVTLDHVYDKLNIWEMFEEIKACFVRKAAKAG